MRGGVYDNKAIPLHGLIYLVSQGFDGLPLAHERIFGELPYYNQITAYVGVIAVVMALVSVAIRWRNPVVLAVVLVAALSAAVVFVPIANTLLRHVPLLGTEDLARVLLVLAFAIAISPASVWTWSCDRPPTAPCCDGQWPFFLPWVWP